MMGLFLAWLRERAGRCGMKATVGLLSGMLLRPTWPAILVSLAAGGLGWGLPLALLALNAPVGRIAAAVEAAIGLTATGGTIIILLTVVMGCVLSIAGPCAPHPPTRVPAIA